MSPLLIAAATAMELRPLAERLQGDGASEGRWPERRSGTIDGRAVILAETGIGVAAAAAAVGVLIARHAPSACLSVGIGGAYAGSFLPVGAAACASEERFLDLGVRTVAGTAGLETIPLPLVPGDPPLYGTLPVDGAWTEALAAACTTEPVPFATSDGISGDLDVAHERAEASGASVESMEGAGVALACLRLGVPFAEVRGISNVTGVRDEGSWEIGRAVGAAGRAVLLALRDGPA